MITTYVIIGLASMALLLACVATGPADGSAVERAAARRRRFVALHPIHVGSHDILCSMVEAGIAPDQAGLVIDRATAQGIKPFTMWLWIQRFDVWSLSVVVAADLTQHELLTHLSAGTVPNLEELKVFAAANGLQVAGRPRRPRGRKVLVDSTSAETSVAPLRERGTWPQAGRADAA